METDFIPLASRLPTAEAGREFRVLILDSPKEARPFRPHTQPEAGAAKAATNHPGGEPRILLQREGDRIVGIRVECSCGERIELACVYEPRESPLPKP